MNELGASVIQFQVNYQTKELYIVNIILKYRKYFLIIILLHIFWVVRYYKGYCLELHEIDEEYRGFSTWIDG